MATISLLNLFSTSRAQNASDRTDLRYMVEFSQSLYPGHVMHHLDILSPLLAINRREAKKEALVYVQIQKRR